MQVSYCGSLQVDSGSWDNIITFVHFVFMELFMSAQIIFCCLHMSDLLLSLCRALSLELPVALCELQGGIPNRHLAPTTELGGLVLKPSEAKCTPAYIFQNTFFFFIFKMVPLVQLLVPGNCQIQQNCLPCRVLAFNSVYKT